eukprot:m.46750 g.46750  ORF g.46750 m.46750 type:complete len:181 (+) comp6799_c0_seq1:54-596(+)
MSRATATAATADDAPPSQAAEAQASDVSKGADTSDTWNCSSCTFENPRHAAKCKVCLTAKATKSRRKLQQKKVAEVQFAQEQEMMRLKLEREAAARAAKRAKAAKDAPRRPSTDTSPSKRRAVTDSSDDTIRRPVGRPPKNARAAPRVQDTQEVYVTAHRVKCKIRASRAATADFGINTR